ncbi:MAG: family 78 glycoside hydrolase catalytic domain, partial [Clostridiales bacterium]|nr:family 78 glycoside hydrolase catalytic domain [Clostridiales bacterium]
MKKTHLRRIIALLLVLCLAMQVGMTGVWAQEGGADTTSAVYELKTEASVNPLGIDVEQPGFSWKMDSSVRSAYQTAYQVKVALSEEALAAGDLVWDSGKVSSDQSLEVMYGGPELQAATRYYWTVTIWDQAGNAVSAEEAAWFETGLMGSDSSVWNGADWIGSPIKTTNTAALNRYQVSMDVQVLEGGKAGIVVNGRNKDNYILFELDFANRLIKVFEYCDNAWGGSYEAGNVPTVNALGDANGYAIPEEAVAAGAENAEHRVAITASGRNVTLTINDATVLNNVSNLLPRDPNNQPRKAQLMSIGFKQEDGAALYDNLVVQNTRTQDIYQNEDFADANGAMSILGEVKDGKLLVANTFELACPVPAVNVKDTFEITKEVTSARLYAAAQGFYDAYINGEKVGEDFYNPGFTDYRLRIQYQTFDVTKMLRQGENMIGAIVGKGWFSGYCGYSGAMKYGEENTFIAQLVINYADGTKDVIVTDDTWKYTDKGPVIDSDYLDGEIYDARLDFDGWGEPGYDDSAWVACGVKGWPSTVKPTNGTLPEDVKFQLSAQVGPTARIERELTPIAVVENPAGHYVYDFGQNMVGTIRLTVKGEKGTSLKIRYGEMSYQNGEIYIKNVRNATNTDVYTLKGDPNGETFIPSLTSHGFRYVEITGDGFDLDSNDIVVSIEGLVLCNVEEVTGGFECSNELINKLQSNIQWGQRGNYLLVPTDCPQR